MTDKPKASKSETVQKKIQAKQQPSNVKVDQEQKIDRLLQGYEIYNSLVETKMGDFQEAKQYLVEILEELLEQGKIGYGVVILSRIKSPDSVVTNWRQKRNLNDIFGTTILTTTEEEVEEIRNAIRKKPKYNISARKRKNEKRGYEAIHFLFHVGESEHKTLIECHMQTHEAYKNVYTHIFYKVSRKINRSLTPEEEQEIARKVQEMYDNEKLAGMQLSGGKKSKLPQMWVTSFNKDGKMEEQKLDESLTLTIMYPFLDISKKRRKISEATGEKDMSEEEDILEQ